MSMPLHHRPGFGEHMALRLETIVQQFDNACELLRSGHISAGANRVERTLKDLKDLVNDTFPFGETRP
jgi:hypothetical protein